MRILLLILTFLSFILTVHAQRGLTQYMCQVSHGLSETAFYLTLGEQRDFEMRGHRLKASILRNGPEVEAKLKRTVTILDATYEKETKKNYPLTARILPLDLRHNFGGRTDIFRMICYPREP